MFEGRGRQRRLQAGQLLWQEGDPGQEVVQVLEGELEVLQESEQGDVAVVRILGRGELLGEMSCLDGSPHSASVRARGPVCLQVLSAGEFREHLQAHPDQWSALFARQSQRLRELTRQVARLGFEPVKLRVAAILLELDRGEAITVTHQELAERVATTRESVSKSLGALARAGLVELQRGRIRVLDRAGLAALGD